MSYTNGTITPPISIEDIQSAVGNTSNDLGTLATEGSVNKWAKFKPERLAVVGMLDDRLDESKAVVSAGNQRMNNRFGLTVPCSSLNTGLFPVLTLGGMYAYLYGSRATTATRQYNWEYVRPSGGESSPFRMTDYNGYCRLAEPLHRSTDNVEKGTDIVPSVINLAVDSNKIQYIWINYPARRSTQSVTWNELIHSLRGYAQTWKFAVEIYKDAGSVTGSEEQTLGIADIHNALKTPDRVIVCPNPVNLDIYNNAGVLDWNQWTDANQMGLNIDMESVVEGMGNNLQLTAVFGFYGYDSSNRLVSVLLPPNVPVKRYFVQTGVPFHVFAEQIGIWQNSSATPTMYTPSEISALPAKTVSGTRVLFKLKVDPGYTGGSVTIFKSGLKAFSATSVGEWHPDSLTGSNFYCGFSNELAQQDSYTSSKTLNAGDTFYVLAEEIIPRREYISPVPPEIGVSQLFVTCRVSDLTLNFCDAHVNIKSNL